MCHVSDTSMFFFLKSVNGKTWFPSCTFEKIVIMSFPKVKAYAYYHLNPHDEVNPVLTAHFQTFTFRQEELSRTDRSELKLGFYLHCSVQLQVSPAPCWGSTALLYFSGDLKRYLSCVYVLCMCVIYHRCKLLLDILYGQKHINVHFAVLLYQPKHTHSSVCRTLPLMSCRCLTLIPCSLKHFHMATEQEDSSSF